MEDDSNILEQAENAFDQSETTLARALLKPLIEREVAAAIRLNASYHEKDVSEEEADAIYVAGIVRAAELGDPEARYTVGAWYDLGEFGFEIDKIKASHIFKELADEGHLHCLWIYACDLLWGRGAFKVDIDKGLSTLNRAIDLGSAKSCITLAIIYNDGECGLSRDIAERDRLRTLARELAGDDYVYDPYE